ncbi:hypothetical protein [Saccharibacillus alkalitolerans]|uniref:DUF3829 domain-containing protein n=1 Tax=Saccharibacillus alkalitolerans TaxID=2705290 RepID=A0ABX0F044_9BACL|nr:hypothetical protein [Saccharibacillus alkalitolerans]NGZ74377.1 hypothetical protein [Saccharibacillus alkalitolerans]
MNVFKRKKGFKPTLLFFAVLFFLGSLPALAHSEGAFSAADSSDSRTPSGIGLEDAERARIFNQSRAMYQFNEIHKSAYDYEEYYPVFKQASLNLFSTAFDPASTREELADALKQLDAFPSYTLYWGESGYEIDRLLLETEMQLHLHTEFGNEPGQWTETEAERAMDEIASIRDRMYDLVFQSYWDAGIRPLFWEYQNFMVDFEDRRNGRKAMLEQAFQYRADVLKRTAAGQWTEAQTGEFGTAVRALETQLAVMASPEAVQTAFDRLQAAYEALPREDGASSALAADLETARPLLGLPKGIRSGQYPASAFGALRRAIRDAERALEKGGTEEQLTQARNKLAAAVAEFHSRKKA